VLAPDPGPGDKSGRLRGVGQALITSPLARTRAGWLEGVFRSRAVTVILARVDDFLVNHPNTGLSYVRRHAAGRRGPLSR
jgi:hypothetical protein